MGQQQLLLIVLGILIVGIAIIVGIYFFVLMQLKPSVITLPIELINLAD